MTTKISTANLDSSITTLIGSGGGPKVTAITYPGNDLAADPAGGQTITLTGTGFVSGCSVFVGTTQASVVTVVSATSVTFTSPALAAATYTLYLVNPDGGTATIVPGISYSGTPIWSTTAGTLGSIYEYAAISNTVAATGDGSISYSVFSGTLPTGSSLNTSTGVISGTSPASAGATTYTFVIRATDAQLQDSDRTFSITINTDVVTWSTPANNSTTTLGKDAASSTTLLATSAAGNAITYTSTALPAGLSISGATVTGTPTVVGNTTSTFTATAATTGRTTTATINWTVSVASDTYFPYTTLLLSGAAATETFIADASVNNFAVTVIGDTKPNNFNPYTPGYYSNLFDGVDDYLSYTSSTTLNFGTGDFTVECWINLGNTTGSKVIIGGTATNSFGLRYGTAYGSNNGLNIYRANSGDLENCSFSFLPNGWYHVAVVRQSSVIKYFVNGTQQTTVGSGGSSYDYPTETTVRIGTSDNGSEDYIGYISNLRVVKGTAVYTSNFTPSTTPLTAIANTVLLTCQSNRFLDNSTNAFTITVYGNTTVSPTTPFVPNTTYATYGSTYFDGTTDYLTVPANAVFNFGTGDFTLEAWIYRTALPENSFIISASGSGGLFWGFATGGDIGWGRAGVAWDYQFAGNIVANRWYHVALTRSGTNMRMFIDGVLLGATQTNSTSYNISTSSLNIGSQGANFYFTGYISNVRVVKGVAVYTGTFTPPSAPLTAITNTSLLTLQTNQPANNSMFLDSSTNALAVTRVGNTSAGTFTPYGANWSNYFGNSNSSISPSANSAFTWGTGNYTIEMWYNPSVSYAAGNGYLFDQASNGTRVQIYNNYVRFFYNNGASELVSSTAGLGLTVGSWHHLAIVRNTGVITMYINGTSCATVSSAANETSTSLRIGDYGGSSYAFNGYISNFRAVKGTAVYTGNFTVPTAPLTAVQASGTNISAITGSATSLLTCQSNGFVDNSVNAFAITTLIGTPTVQRFSPFSPQTQTAITHSGYFDGTGDYLTAPASQGAAWNFTGDFTFECWIYPNPLTGYHTLLGQWGSGDNTLIWKFNSSGRMYFENLNGAAITATSTTIVANQWQHIALTRSSNTIRMFVNGVQDATTATRSQTYNSSGPMLVGASGVAEAVNGYISNMRIVKGVAVYTVNFTPPTAPLTATQSAGTNIAAITGTQTSLLTCQSPTFIDNSTNLFAITAFDGAKPRTLNPFGFTNASAAYSAATYGGSAYFDGTTDSLAAPANSAFQFTGDYTVEFWVNFSSVSTEVDLVGNYASNVGTDWMILKTSNGTFQYYPSSAASFINGPTPVANRWYHVAIGRSGASCKLYVDGILYGTALTFSGTLGDASKSVYIGSRGGSANILTGYISNVRIVKGVAVYTSNFVPPSAPLTAITNTSLLLNMTSAGIVDATMINDLETVGDAKRVSTQTPYAGSYYSNYFDGTGDYLSAAASSNFDFGSENFTIETWFYASNDAILFSNDDDINNGGVVSGSIALTAAGTGIFFYRRQTSGAWAEEFSYSAAIAQNTWHHVAVVKSGTNIKIFFNGSSVLSTTAVNTTFGTSAKPFSIGGRFVTNYRSYLNGYISNLRVVKGTAVYTGTFTPPTAPLTATQTSGTNIAAVTGTATSLLTCQSNRFVDNSANAFAITKYDNTSVQSFNPFQRNSATTLYFDGTGDYLVAPYNPAYNFGTGNFTIEFWVNTTSTAAYATALRLGNTWTTGSWSLYLNDVNGSGVPSWWSFTLNTTLSTSGVTINDGAWHHIALVRNSTTMTMYIDGTSRGTLAVSTSSVGDTTTQLWIARDGGHLRELAGYINDLRITKGVARYTGTFTPPTTAFIAR